jgi:hypothetical protein
MPTQSSITLHLGALHDHGVIALDAIDLLDRRTATAVDERWTLDSDVAPIDNGDATDLVWLRDGSGGVVPRNPGYGSPTRFAAPVSVRISLSSAF